jgi:hypothetical protein
VAEAAACGTLFWSGWPSWLGLGFRRTWFWGKLHFILRFDKKHQNIPFSQALLQTKYKSADETGTFFLLSKTAE